MVKALSIIFFGLGLGDHVWLRHLSVAHKATLGKTIIVNVLFIETIGMITFDLVPYDGNIQHWKFNCPIWDC